ncbi:MAG: hypothetical protein DMF83_26725 [Acidobacteria bacterium]|nr:MAG: hypothetical protein DMF83_26725 [Acidobacteriota bacterium]
MAAKVVEIAEVNSARGFVDSIALPRDVSYVATSERGGRIRLWTAAGTEEPITLQYRQAVVDLAFSPNGGLLASLGRHGEGALRLWQPQARGRDGLEGGGRRPHGQLPVAALRGDAGADPPLLGQWLAAPGPAPAARCPAPGGVVAPTGDRRGMRLFDVSRKTSRIVASGGKAYHAVAIADDSSGFAAITSDLSGGTLTYDVEVWRLAGLRRS